jgi:hypothetical protein
MEVDEPLIKEWMIRENKVGEAYSSIATSCVWKQEKTDR